jgi:luciferase-like monooxygenase
VKNGYLSEFRELVSAWPGVSVQPHRFAGVEFCFGKAEIGHIHPNGMLDIPMPRAIHDLLLEEGLAEQHHWLPDSGWITFPMPSERELTHGLWLARISYLRYALKTSADPHSLLTSESQSLGNVRLAKLLENLLPAQRQSATA